MSQFNGFIPTPNQTNVPRTTLVGFTVLEQPNGAQINTLAVIVDGYQAILSGAFVNGYTGKIFPSTGKWVVGIYPKAPDFIRAAAQITVHIDILDGYNNLDAYNYAFFTAGYNPPPPEPIQPQPTRPCIVDKPFFPPTDLGLVSALDEGTGTEVELNWKQAHPYDEDNIVYYNVYIANKRADVFDGYPEFIAEDTTITIGGIAPGDQLFFGVRVGEFDPNLFTTTGLKQAGTSMFFYPDAYVDGVVNSKALIIPASSVSGFPDFGILRIGDELIAYSAKSQIPPRFIVRPNGRGYQGTTGEEHTTGQNIFLYPGRQDGNTIIAQAEPTFQKPNYAITNVLHSSDCALDGYRDGYDGYAYTDGYLRFRQETVDSLTTDGKNNDESGDFSRFDYCGSYRTHSPISFMDGQCTGSYWGGVQMIKDPTDPSKNVKVRVPDVRTHMLQREELLLETTGEPFVLARRMWTGARCPCFMQRREHPDKRCPICFPPGTLIRAKRGLVPIENIEVGEEVLTVDGSYRKVLETMRRQYDGYLQNISTATSSSISATPEHPFLVMRNEHEVVRPCGPKCNMFIVNGDGTNRNATPKLLPSGNWWARVTAVDGSRIALGTFGDKRDAEMAIENYYKMTFKPQHRLEWDDVKNIKRNDWLVCKWNTEIKDMGNISVPNKYRKNTKLGSKRIGVDRFQVDEDFLWVIGLYIAEGSVGTRCINFSLHREEYKIQNRLFAFFRRYGYNPKTRQTSENGINVEVNSTTLANWFPTLCGCVCDKKKIPEELMRLPHNKTWAIIKGIYDGDGIKAENEIGQTSKILALQLVELLHRVGKQPLLRFQISNSLTPAGNERKLCYIVSWEKDDFHHNNRKNRWDFKGEKLSKVKDVKATLYSGPVYNLEIEGNNTYIVENIVVHNCYGTGFIQGYTQFFNPRRPDRRILVRIDPATDDLSIVDRGGLEPAYEPSAWTLPFPAIKDRDILIRFNPDNTEAWRYFVLNVTRNKAFFTQTGAQKLALKRVPKTDVTYQFPIIRDTRPVPVTGTTSVNAAPAVPAHQHQIVIPQDATIATLKAATLESQGHNHVIFNGIVQEVLNHSHTIIT